jgi:hypothetical protein
MPPAVAVIVPMPIAPGVIEDRVHGDFTTFSASTAQSLDPVNSLGPDAPRPARSRPSHCRRRRESPLAGDNAETDRAIRPSSTT